QVWRLGQQHFAFGQRFADQAELVMFEVAQPSVDQLAAGGGGVAGKVVAFAEEYRKSAPGRIGGNARAVDPAADDGDIVEFGDGTGGIGHEVLLDKRTLIFECEHPSVGRFHYAELLFRFLCLKKINETSMASIAAGQKGRCVRRRHAYTQARSPRGWGSHEVQNRGMRPRGESRCCEREVELRCVAIRSLPA